MHKKCWACCGAKKLLSGGGVYKDCDTCHGEGFIKEINYLKKDTTSYKSAKKNLKKLDPKLSDEEIEKVLDEEIERQK